MERDGMTEGVVMDMTWLDAITGLLKSQISKLQQHNRGPFKIFYPTNLTILHQHGFVELCIT
jgi:hypothetical protein